MRANAIKATFAAIAASLLVAAVASAEPTRADYLAQTEPICKANTDANARILKGVRAKAKSGRLAAAGRQFARAADAFAATLTQIKAVPQPSADTTLLAQWTGYLDLEQAYLAKIATALKQGSRARSQGFALRLKRNADLANQTVVGFGFNSCLIDPSKFL